MTASNQQTSTNAPLIRKLSYQELDILHCLRGFCAFYVVVYHAKYFLWVGGKEYMTAFPRVTWGIWNYFLFALDIISSAGYEMVIFFFVLSGFFIRYAQLRKHRALKDFYINRIVRIYPPYLVSALLAAGILFVVARWIPEVLNKSIGRELNTSLSIAWNDLCNLDFIGILRTLLFVPVHGQIYLGYNTVYWSLLPEGLFYLIVPLAFWRIRAYYTISVFFYLLGIVAKLLHHDLSGVLSFLLMYNFYFAVGIALHDIVIHTDWLEKVRHMNGWLLGIVALVLFVLLLPLALLKLKVFSGIIAVLLAILTVSTLLAGRVSSRNLILRFFHPIGIFSFSLYLYHIPLLIACSAVLTLFTGDLIFYVRYYWLAIPLVTLICYMLYWLTERLSVNYFRRV
jgi:peptidoglycan/LPS O-acetylase OafA/YrhL